MELESIKNCPHCGSEAVLMSSYSPRIRKYFVYVKCEVCGAQGKSMTTDIEPASEGWNSYQCDTAVTAWNRRV